MGSGVQDKDPNGDAGLSVTQGDMAGSGDASEANNHEWGRCNRRCTQKPHPAGSSSQLWVFQAAPDGITSSINHLPALVP